LTALEAYGFAWDGEVIFQSRSATAHQAALQILVDQSMAYPCGCSRKSLANEPRGPLGVIYPGTCRDGCDLDETAIRLQTDNDPVSFSDGLQGLQTQRLESASGDFVIKRRDGLIAYQLAVVVDDELEGVTEIVRGMDIMDSTQRQIWLQKLLGYQMPDYVHIPVITHPDGDKLSKLTGAPGVTLDDVRGMLVAALQALRQEPPADLAASSLPDIWQWAVHQWKLEPLQGVTEISTDVLAANILTATPSMP